MMRRYGLHSKREAVGPRHVILNDTSGWVDFLRGTASVVCREVERLLAGDPAVTDPVVMEVLAGARDDEHLGSLRCCPGRASRTARPSVDCSTT